MLGVGGALLEPKSSCESKCSLSNGSIAEHVFAGVDSTNILTALQNGKSALVSVQRHIDV